MKDEGKKGRSSIIADRLKKMAALSLVVAGSLTASATSLAPGQQVNSISDRVVALRETVAKGASQTGSPLAANSGDPKMLLAQYWANAWQNWNNWNNWHDWLNWGNWGNW